MHAVVMDSLEEYLSGTLEPAVERSVEAHLSTCRACREELSGIEDVSQLFVALRAEEEVAASPGFFSGVLQQVAQQAEAQRPAASWSSLFGLDFVFGRRLVFASLMMLAVLGTYLVSREVDDPAVPPSAEAVMAQQESPSFDSAPADNMLVTLTAYEQR
jgi:anti-sigma factor RsiW